MYMNISSVYMTCVHIKLKTKYIPISVIFKKQTNSQLTCGNSHTHIYLESVYQTNLLQTPPLSTKKHNLHLAWLSNVLFLLVSIPFSKTQPFIKSTHTYRSGYNKTPRDVSENYLYVFHYKRVIMDGAIAILCPRKQVQAPSLIMEHSNKLYFMPICVI